MGNAERAQAGQSPRHLLVRSLKEGGRGTQGSSGKLEEGLLSFKSTCRSNGGEKGPPELVQCRRLSHLLGGVARDRQDEPGAR